MSEHEESDDFDGYVETSVDPGPVVLIATVIICALMLAILPILVASDQAYQRRKRQKDNASEPSNKSDAHEVRVRSNDIFDISSIVFSTYLLFQNQGDRVDDRHDGAAIKAGESGLPLDSHPRSGVNVTRAHGGTTKAESREQQRQRHDEARRKPIGPEGIDVELTEDGSVSNQSALFQLDDNEGAIRHPIDAGNGLDARHDKKDCQDDIPFWKPAAWGPIFDSLLVVAEYDYEMKRIVKLALPFVGQALIEGLTVAVNVALVGRFVSTRAMAAYVGVDMLIGLSASFLSGFKDSLQVLLSQAIGARNKNLAGQYMQINMIFFIALFSPIAVFWIVYMEIVLEWFGFDDDIVKLGVDFSRIYIFVQVMKTVSHQIHALLDVIGRQNYSTIVGMVEEVLGTFGVLMVGLGKNPTLDKIGLVHLLISALGLFANVMYVMYRGWFDEFLGGIVGTFAMLVSAIAISWKFTCIF